MRGRSKKIKPKAGNPDYILLMLVTVLVIFGLIMVFEASIYNADQYFNDRFYFVKQQILWILIGGGIGAIMYFWDYRKIANLALPGIIVGLVLLVAVLFLGEEINGARRWFKIGIVPIQPAELIKPVFIVYLSKWLSKDRIGFKNLREAVRYHFVYELGAFLVLLGLIGGLVLLEPDLGTTIVICVVAFVIYFVSGSDAVHTFGSILIVIVGGLLGLLAAVLEPYRLERIKTFLDLILTGDPSDKRGSGYQIWQILIGIGSGGPKGVGFGASRQRFGFLVEITAFTDSIFAIILEELGYGGGVLVILFFLIFLLLGFRIAARAPDKLGRLMAGGICFWLVFQAFMHMGANVAMVPLTGVPLPFFTYGGSSTIVALGGVGLLLNISKYGKNPS